MQPKNDLAEQYYYLVEKVAKAVSYKNPYVHLSDLISSGAEGLFRATQTFKEELGVPFEAYARLRIHGAMVDDIRKNDWVPRYQRDKQKKLDAYQHEIQSPVSLDILVKDSIRDTTVSIEDSYEQREQLSELVSALGNLPQKEYQAIALYYYEDLKMHEIARVLDVTESYVSRLISSSIKKLRTQLASNKNMRKVKL